MFSIIYTLVLAANIFFGGKFAKYAIKRLKEEGYTYPFKDKELKEKIFEILPVALLLFLPLLNVATLAAGIVAFKDEDKKEKFYDTLKEVLEKTGVIIQTDKVEAPVAKKENYYTHDEIEEAEEKIRTHHDAASLWLSQHEAELREELKKHECPTIDFGNNNDSNELESGYQKTLKR